MTALLIRFPTRWNRLRRWSVAFFGAATVASLAGGADHGFFRRDGRDLGHDLLWTTSLLAIGASSLALVGIGAERGLSRTAARRLVAAATRRVRGLRAGRALCLARLPGRDPRLCPGRPFPACDVHSALPWQRDRGSRLGITAVLLAFAAAAVQRLEIGIDADLTEPQRALPPDPGHLVRAALRGHSRCARRACTGSGHGESPGR